MVPRVSLRWKNHHNTLVTVLDKLLQNETFVDVILAAEGKFIKVHRIVLCACSEYFESLLSQETDKQAIIFLKDVSFDNLKAIVDYIYKGEVNISQDQLLSFLHTTEALTIKGLADEGKRGPPTQPKSTIASKIKRVAEQQQAKGILPAQLPNIASTSTIGQVEELPQLQEIQPALLPVITSASTIGEIEDMPEIQENNHLIDDSQTMHTDTDDHFITLNPEAEDSDIDISAEHLEGGDEEGDTEDDWTNSEGRSVSSATDLPGASDAGPSKAEPNEPNDDQGAKPKGRFTCEKCGRSYKYNYHLRRHLRYKGCVQDDGLGVLWNFTCETCGTSYKTEHHLRDHQNRQKCTKKVIQAKKSRIRKRLTQRRFPCEHCGKSYKYKHHLSYHKRHHGCAKEDNDPLTAPSFNCVHCGKSYKTEYHLKDHQRHTECGKVIQEIQLSGNPEVRFTCQQCGNNYKHQQDLRNHVRRNGCIKEKCPHCPYETRRKDSFELHLRRHTQGGPVHACQICGYTTQDSCNYKRHLKKVHDVEARQSSDHTYHAS